jgi:DNA-binding transcriptional LysR family regulator
VLEAVSLDQLRMLIAIADSGSFSAAARRLGRAQSAISHGIGQLEDALALRLFDRRERRPRLTEAGQTVLVDARSLVTGAAELRARARSIAEGMEPELSLAVDVMFPMALLIRAIKALRENFPLLPVTLHTEALGAVEARVADGSARLGIGPNWPGDPGQGIERRFLATVTMASVAAAGHPLAAWTGIVPRRELERHVQLVLTDRSQLSAGLLRSVVSPHAWRFGDMQTRYEFLLAGLGFCNMPLHMVEGDLAAGRLKRIEVEGWGPPNYGLPLHLVFRRGYQPGKAAAWLIARIEQEFAAGGIPAAATAS